jgi:hypothetical protein
VNASRSATLLGGGRSRSAVGTPAQRNDDRSCVRLPGSRGQDRARRPAQALVEAALILPLLLLLALGGVGIGRLVQARMAIDAVAREAARAAVLSPMPSVRSNGSAEWQAAKQNGEEQGQAVASGYRLDNVTVLLERERDFSPGSWVSAYASVVVPAIHVPFMERMFNGSGSPMITLSSRHWERIDPYRSRLP